MAPARNPRVGDDAPLSQGEEGKARTPAQGRVSARILFDGVCNLCHGFVRFVIPRDPSARFRFAALQSSHAASLLRDAGVTGPLPDSVVLVQNGRAYFRSDAALRIARGLRFPWRLAYGF